MSAIHIRHTSKNPGCLVQLLWFALVGWWAGQLWIAVAWLLMATIVGAPLAIVMIHNLPKVIALRDPSEVVVKQVGQQVIVSVPRQRPFVLRALWFVLIGWWLSAIWMEAAYVLCLSIIGLPLGFWMFDRVPAILTLKR